MKILVTGSTGLVGSALLRKCETANLDYLGISSRDLDLRDRDNTFNFINKIKPDLIINAAALVGGIGANDSKPVDFLSQNLQIQTNLIDAAFEAKVKKFIFLGSSCIYPRDSIQPIKEHYLMTGLLEKTNTAYAIAKIAGIELIKSYRRQYNVPWISIMPTNLYGPNDNFDLFSSHVIPALIHKFSRAKKLGIEKVELWGTGTSKREFLHVDDLAEAVLICADRYDDDLHINVGSGQEISILDLAKEIQEAVEFKGEIEWNTKYPDGTPRKILDSSRLRQLGWSAKISLRDGLRSTISWFLDNYFNAEHKNV
jgi:GDP-L-fucose synthase